MYKIISPSCKFDNSSLLHSFLQVSAVFEEVTTLDVSYSLNLVTTPDFSNFPNLETLSLKGCKSLEEVHVSIGSLVKLVSLNMGDCVNLGTLPDSICNLKALNSFNINGCSTLIRSLTEVNAWGLIVWKLPISIGHLSKLVELNPKYAASNETRTCWDVFLCYRGISTQEAFSNRLYKALCRSFISIFMDNLNIKNKITLSDVRGQTGSFKEAFEQYQILYAADTEKVNKWRLSLREVTDFSGHHISQSR